MSTDSDPTPSQSPGSWLSRQMKRRAIAVRRLADEMGVTTKTVYDWRDDRTAISEARVPKLAEVLSVSEVEARRALGYWVPTGADPEPASDADLDAVEALLEQALAELNRLKREREKPA